MKRIAMVATALLLLSVPLLVRADDWERVAPGASGGYSQGAAAAAVPGFAQAAAPQSAGTDFQVLNRVVDSVKSAQPNNDPCGMIGLLAAVAATTRDQGLTRDQQLQDAICGFNRLVSGTHATLEWTQDFAVLMDREIDFAYRHPDMTGAQVMTYWTRVCESPLGVVAPAQQPIENLPTP
ncbi:MAG: hypothetical protein ACREQI_06450 [Candidatus Binataceae bacterium]